jgi:hypothetical protein
MPNEANGSIKVGDRVKVLGAEAVGGLRGRVVELRGPLGPGGAEVYRIRFGGKRRPNYTEVLADQLEVIPADQ